MKFQAHFHEIRLDCLTMPLVLELHKRLEEIIKNNQERKCTKDIKSH